MHFKHICNSKETDKFLKDQFKDYKLSTLKVIKDIEIVGSRFDDKLNIYMRGEYYGEIFVDNGVIESYTKYYPIIKAGRISHNYGIHTTDIVYLSDICDESRGKDFTLNDDMLKNLVVAQLRKSFPMATFPDPE